MTLKDAGEDVERQGHTWSLEASWTDAIMTPIRLQ